MEALGIVLLVYIIVDFVLNELGIDVRNYIKRYNKWKYLKKHDPSRRHYLKLNRTGLRRKLREMLQDLFN